MCTEEDLAWLNGLEQLAAFEPIHHRPFNVRQVQSHFGFAA